MFGLATDGYKFHFVAINNDSQVCPTLHPFLNRNRTDQTVLVAYIRLEFAVRAGRDYFTADENHETRSWACSDRDGSMNIIVVNLFIGLC